MEASVRPPILLQERQQVHLHWSAAPHGLRWPLEQQLHAPRSFRSQGPVPSRWHVLLHWPSRRQPSQPVRSWQQPCMEDCHSEQVLHVRKDPRWLGSSRKVWRNVGLSCRTNTAHSNRAGVIRARLTGGYQMVGGGINNHYRHFNKLSAFEESYPEGNNWRCDTGFGPGRLTRYSRMCRMNGMHCTTRSVHKNGSGIAYAHLPGGYVATGGGVYNHSRHFNKHSAFETSIPHGSRSWRCDMGLGYGRFNCYVRGCRATHNKRLHCITRTSRSGNWHNVQCPGGYSVTGYGQNEQRRQWNHLSGFEEMRVHGNGCVCDSGFGGGNNRCYARCCRQLVAKRRVHRIRRL